VIHDPENVLIDFLRRASTSTPLRSGILMSESEVDRLALGISIARGRCRRAAPRSFAPQHDRQEPRIDRSSSTTRMARRPAVGGRGDGCVPCS